MPILLLLFFFLSYEILYAQVAGQDDGWPYENSALIWQGFTQEWSYNHRLNRLGDYIASQSIQQDTLMASIHHNASTGTGTDAGPYASYYSYIAANDVHFTTGDTTLTISGIEGQMSTLSFVIRGHLAAHLKNKKQHAVLLNGFDLCATAKADKIEQLAIDLRDGYYDHYRDELFFDGHIQLTADCKSPECSPLKNKFSYEIKICYLIISADDEIAVTSAEKGKYISWNKEKEYLPIPEEGIIKGLPYEAFNAAILGIQSLSLQLDQEQWFVSWHSALKPSVYDPLSGEYSFFYDLVFKQWKENMKKESFNPKQSFASSRKSGWANFSSRIIMIQLRNAWVEPSSVNGVIFAEGKNPRNECGYTMENRLLRFHPDACSFEEAMQNYSADELEELLEKYRKAFDLSREQKKNNRAQTKK